MANGIHDVYTRPVDPSQGISQEQLAAIARAQGAQSQLSGLKQSPAMATALRQSQTPLAGVRGQGLSATAPTWLEALGTAALRNKGQRSLSSMDEMAKALRGDVAAGAGAQQQAELAKQAYEQTLSRENVLAESQLREQAAQRASSRSLLNQQQMAREQDRLLRGRKAEEREIVSFHHPATPAKTINFEKDSTGQFYDLDNNPVPGAYVQNLTPWKAPATGSVGFKERKYLDEKNKSIADDLLAIDQAGLVIKDKNLRDATGPAFDVKKLLATYGFDEEAQATQIRASGVSLDAVGPRLDKLGVNPTDKDLAEAFKTIPTTTSEPLAWLDWYEKTYTPAMISAFARAGRTDLIPQIISNMGDTLKKGYEVQYPEKFQERYGGKQTTEKTGSDEFAGFSIVN